MYDRDLGRFLQRDPSAILWMEGLYSYGAGAPVNWRDPRGWAPEGTVVQLNYGLATKAEAEKRARPELQQLNGASFQAKRDTFLVLSVVIDASVTQKDNAKYVFFLEVTSINNTTKKVDREYTHVLPVFPFTAQCSVKNSALVSAPFPVEPGGYTTTAVLYARPIRKTTITIDETTKRQTVEHEFGPKIKLSSKEARWEAKK